MAARTILAFDYGSRRTGVAVGQELIATARALATLATRAGQPDWAAIERLVAEWRPDLFVVGIPARADGTPHALRPAIERFARRLSGRFGLPVSFADERLSSYEARDDEDATRAGVDAVAARLILETWLAENGTSGHP